MARWRRPASRMPATPGAAVLASMISIIDPFTAFTKTVLLLEERQLTANWRCSTYHCASRFGSGDAMAVCSMPLTMCAIVTELIEPGLMAHRLGVRNAAEPPLPSAEFANGGAQIVAIEVRAHAPRKDQFGIGAFPEQKVAEALL